MAIIQGQTTAFKNALYQLYFLNSGYTFKIALYTAGVATLDGTVTAYSAANEVVGTGYTAGGATLTGTVVSFDATSGAAFVTFNNAVWPSSAISARAALIYNSTVGNAAIAVLDFGQTITSSNTFTIQMPASGPTTALIRST